MFEDANLFIGLDDASPETRLETVEKLRSSVRQGGGELPVHNLTQLFQLMSDRLKDNDNRVALMSAELLCDLLNRDLLTTDIYFPIVLPAMFQNLANERRRDSSVYVLTTYVEAMGGADCILEGMVQHGLMHDKAKVREQTLLTLPTIVEGYLVPSASAGREDYMKLLEELTHRLNDNDPKVVEAAGLALHFAKGEDKNFNKHVGALGQATMDVVTAVLSTRDRSQSSSGSGSGGVSSSNTTSDTETKRSQSEFESKDTMLILKEQEDSAMEAVAKLDQLDEKSSGAVLFGNLDGGSGGGGGMKTSDHVISTTTASSPSSPLSIDDEDNLFTRDQKNEIDRIRAGDGEQQDDRNSSESVSAEIGVGDLESPGMGSPPIDENEFLDNSPQRDVNEKEKKQKEEAEETKTEMKMTKKPPSQSVRIDISSSETDKVNNIQKERDAYSEIHGKGRDAPVAGGVVRLVFGIITSPTMDNLRNQSSWKLRASAIEEVLATVSEMSDADVRLVRPHVPELFKVSKGRTFYCLK